MHRCFVYGVSAIISSNQEVNDLDQCCKSKSIERQSHEDGTEFASIRPFQAVHDSVDQAAKHVNEADDIGGSGQYQTSHQDKDEDDWHAFDEVLMHSHGIIELKPGLVAQLRTVPSITTVRPATDGGLGSRERSFMFFLELVHELFGEGLKSGRTYHNGADKKTLEAE